MQETDFSLVNDFFSVKVLDLIIRLILLAHEALSDFLSELDYMLELLLLLNLEKLDCLDMLDVSHPNLTMQVNNEVNYD